MNICCALSYLLCAKSTLYSLLDAFLIKYRQYKVCALKTVFQYKDCCLDGQESKEKCESGNTLLL